MERGVGLSRERERNKNRGETEREGREMGVDRRRKQDLVRDRGT